MFPLQSVLFPRAVLPLEIFEPRYVQMIDEAIDGDRTFGVVLISRGREVGGGDQRVAMGTVARIVRAGPVDDGRQTLVAIGEQRLEVVEWLPEDPYPAAMVIEADSEPVGSGTDALVDRARRAYRRTLAIASELGGRTADPEPDLPDDPLDAAWFLCDAAPLEQFDRQRLLEIDGVDQRLQALIEGLDAKADLLQARLGRG